MLASPRCRALVGPLLTIAAICSGPTSLRAQERSAATPEPLDYRRQIEPLFAEFCHRCHGEDKQKGDVRLDGLDPAMTARADAEGFHSALDMINSGEMPPKDEPQPTDAQRRLLVGWLTESLRQAADRQKGERTVVLRRLTREQYSRSLQDLLGLDIDFTRRLPADGKAKNGFTNNGEVLQASPLHIENYQLIAREALAAAIAIGPKPKVTRYRVTFGEGIGKGKVAGHTGGYQSVPLPTEDFTVEILDDRGQPITGDDEAERAAREAIQRRISVGLRGSGQDRFQIVDEGMILLSALPHREVVPEAWQGPSPNLELEMQRCWPERGNFVMRVKASRGYVPPLRRQMLVALDKQDGTTAQPMVQVAADGSLVTATNAQVLAAEQSDQRENLAPDGDLLVPVAVPEDCKARLRFALPADGFYQIDMVHRPAKADQMPSVRLRAAGHHLDQRPQATAEQLQQPRVVTPLGAIGMKKGTHHLQVGGPFFVGFSHVVITPMPAEHALVKRLSQKVAEQDRAAQALIPSLRPLIGTRTDDGMDYTTFDEPQEVHAPLGQAQTYEFSGRLENLPIPELESGDNEELSGFLLLGVWNDHLVKSAKETGPPLLVESIEFEAPWLPVWPPPSHRQIFADSDQHADEGERARAVLARFVTRAFRRPVADHEVERYVACFREIRAASATFEAAIHEVLVAVLCSPEFLFLCEPEDTLGKGRALPDWALANRLSYFLWNAPPDAPLRALADAGRLRGNLLAEVDRLLDDDRAWSFVRSFSHEWLRLDRHDGVTIDVDRHRDYTRFVKRDMRDETYAFVHRVLHEDLPLTTLVDADFAMLNQNLAEFYGVPGVLGARFRPVPVTEHPERRGGLLSHGAFLAGHSDGSEPHPIKRAVWLKARLLGDPPPPPPPNVPELDREGPKARELTLKQQLEAHRDKASCRDCHAGIDPFGLVFERLSAVGRLEPERKGHPIDATSTLPDGTEVDGLRGIQDYLLHHVRDHLARAFVAHLFAYALGRETYFADAAEIDQILQQVRIAGYRTRSVIRAIVASPSFQSK
jgi:mono/diheme cytochrome c family protein